MRTIVISTSNQDKLKELKAIISSDYQVLSKAGLGFGDLEIEETGTSLRENALLKVRGLAQAMKEKGMDPSSYWIVADDTGLFVDGLDGAPGIYSARYAGPHASYQDNVDKLLAEMEGVEDRKAQFRTDLAVLHAGEEEVFEGVLPGEILQASRGQGGFGYDPVFYLPDQGKSLAEMGPEEKNRISHRRRAYQAFWESLNG